MLSSLLAVCPQALVDIDLSGNGITTQGGKALAGGIAASCSLAAVALDNNDLREEGAQVGSYARVTGF